jgi:hypothetical protein
LLLEIKLNPNFLFLCWRVQCTNFYKDKRLFFVMNEYWVSVADEDLRKSFCYESLTKFSESSIGDFFVDFGMGKKGDDDRWYFMTVDKKIDDTVRYLDCGGVEDIRVHFISSGDLPDNLRPYIHKEIDNTFDNNIAVKKWVEQVRNSFGDPVSRKESLERLAVCRKKRDRDLEMLKS